MFNIFRQSVKSQLRKHGLTYAQLAKKSSIAESTIKGFMCGASDSRRVAEKIANSLDCALLYENGIYMLTDKEENTCQI